MPDTTAAAAGFEPIDPNAFQPIDPGSFTGSQPPAAPATPEVSPSTVDLPSQATHYDEVTAKKIKSQFRSSVADALLSGDKDLQNKTIADIGIEDPYMASMARNALDMNEAAKVNPSLFSTGSSAVVDGAKAVNAGLKAAPENIVMGAADALDNSIKLGTTIGNSLVPADAQVDTKNVSLFNQTHDSESFVRDATAFTAGFIGANKVLGGVGILAKGGATATLVRGGLAAGIGSAVTTDATPEARLSDFISANPHLRNPISDFLSANVYSTGPDGKTIVTSKDESEAMGRLRNGLENSLAGPLVDKLVGVIAGAAKWAVGKVKPGTPEAAAIEQQITTAVQKADEPVIVDSSVKDAVRSTSNADRPTVMTPKGERRVSISVTSDDNAGYAISRIKLHDDKTGMYSTFDVPENSFKDPVAAEEFGHKIVQDHFGANGSPAGVAPQAKLSLGEITAPPKVIPKEASDRILAAAQNGVSPEDSLQHVNINVPKMTDSVTAANIIHQIALELPEGALATKGWNLEQNAKEAANLLGVGSTEFTNGLQALAGSAENIPRYLVASRMVISQKASELSLISRKIIGPLSSPEVQQEWLAKQLELQQIRKPFLELQAGGARGVTSGNTKVTGAQLADGSVVGQTLDAQGKPTAQTGGKPVDPSAKPIEPNQATINEGALKAGLSPEQAEMAAKMAVVDPSDWKAAVKLSNAVSKGMAVFNEVFINSILSSPQTLAANLASVATIIGQPIEKIIGGGITATFGRQGGKAAMLEGVSHLMALKSATFDIIAAMKAGFDSPVLRTLKTEKSVLDPGKEKSMVKNGKVQPQEGIPTGTVDHGPSITAANLLPDSLQGTAVAGAVDYLGQVIRIPTRLMTTTDELLKQINYRAFVMGRATREGMFKNLEGKDLENFVHDYISKAYDETGAGTHAAALYNSQTATFTNPLMPGSIGAGISKLATTAPVVRTVIPFIRTPSNVIRGIGMRTPIVQFAYRELRQDLVAGGYKQAEALGKIAMGATMYTAAGILAASGVITGGGPKDPTLKAQKMATGWRPYSMKAGDSYYGFNRLDPVSMFLGLAADFHEVSGQIDQGASEDLAMNMSVALIRNLSNKSYLQGLTNALDALSKPETAGKRFVNQLAGGAVPFSGFSKALNRQLDPYANDVRTLMDSVRSSVPGYGATLPPRRNILGEPVLVPDGLGPDMLSPVATSTDLKDSVKSEISRLNHPFAIPKPQVGNVDLRNYVNDKNQTAYDRVQELTGTVNRDGMNLKEALAFLIESPKYKDNGTDNDPFVGQGSRVSDIQVLLQKRREDALKQTEEEFPKLKNDMEQDRMNKKDLQHNRVDQIQKIAQ